MNSVSVAEHKQSQAAPTGLCVMERHRIAWVFAMFAFLITNDQGLGRGSSLRTATDWPTSVTFTDPRLLIYHTP